MSNKKRTGTVPGPAPAEVDGVVSEASVENEATDVVEPAPDPAPMPKAKITEKKPAPQAPASAGFCVYIGPSIPGLIQSGHIYSGSRADVLKALAPVIEKRPLVASLVVDGTNHVADRIKVKTPGNLLHVNYKKLASGENK